MLIACDVDGVLADLMPEWLRRYNLDFGDTLTPAALTNWDLQQFVRPEARERIFEYLRQPDLYDAIKPITDAQWGVDALRAAGHKVEFVTKCVPGMTDQKAAWLVRHGFSKAGHSLPKDMVIMANKTRFTGDLLIDDRGDTVERWIETGRRAVLFTQPWNAETEMLSRHWRWCMRLGTWAEVVTHLTGVDG